MIIFEYNNGKKESFNNYRVTPYALSGMRMQNPSTETIANILAAQKPWLILPEKEGGLEKVINPHQIKSISRD